MSGTDGLLFNPHTYDPAQFDPETRRLLRATIEWFESRGKKQLLQDDLDAVWVSDFLEFVGREKLFATFQTPAAFADGDENRRWDGVPATQPLSEIFGFYGLAYWYAWQVTILGLGPIWMSDNDAAKKRAAQELADGGVMAFGLSERDHGADVYSTDMLLTPTDGDVAFRASGEKYYIGNGNVAGMVSVFGRRTDVEGPEGYVFFVADSAHPNYQLVDNVLRGQMYVSNFRLDDYPVREEDILHTGVAAFEAALNTVNVGKFNLCTGSIGITEHAFFEGNHSRAESNSVRQSRHGLCPRSRRLRRRVLTSDRDEAVQCAGGRLLPQRQPRGPSLPAVQSHDQGQGHLRR